MQKAIDKKVLPKEYGGNVPIKDMIGKPFWHFFLFAVLICNNQNFRAIQAKNEGTRKKNSSPGANAHLHQTWI